MKLLFGHNHNHPRMFVGNLWNLPESKDKNKDKARKKLLNHNMRQLRTDPGLQAQLADVPQVQIRIFRDWQHPFKNRARIFLEETKENLPKGLKKYYNGKTLFEFKTTDMLNPKKVNQFRDVLSKELKTIPKKLANGKNQMGAADIPAKDKPLSEKGFSQVAGMDELKNILDLEVVGPHKTPAVYKKVGKKPPNGIFLFGPPGCGKTYVTERLAEELELPLLTINMQKVGSPYIHETARLLGEFLDDAAKKAPCIVRIDELEQFLPNRADLGSSSEYMVAEVDALLEKMNNCREKGVLVIGASNMPHKLDPAALRPGRLDNLLYVGPPDTKSREAAFKFCLKDKFAEGIDAERLANNTKGYTFADISAVIDKALSLKIAEARQVDPQHPENVVKPVTTETLADALKLIRPSIYNEQIEATYKTILTRGMENGIKTLGNNGFIS